MTQKKAFLLGLLAGLIAGLAMTAVMLLLACFRVATPLAIIGDRLSVFISPGPFLKLMGKVGGYNHLKQLGIGSTLAGQLAVSALGGAVFGLFMRRDPNRRATPVTVLAFILLPLVAVALVLWPVLGTSYRGFPIAAARIVTLVGFALSVFVYERTLVASFRFLAGPRADDGGEFTPTIGRRAFVLGGVGLFLVGGSAALMRKLYRVATFSYDGTQYKGRIVQPITPNELFYCVTKNVVDPRVDMSVWHLEVDGLVQHPETHRFEDLKAFAPVEQETTLMCISNGLEAGLISNAVWKGTAMRDLLDQVAPLSNAAKVRLYGVDNYTDTIPLEKAMNRTTLIAYEMNGQPLADRHGFPARVVVPGYFGEKHVKWLTRIEVTTGDAAGFYEKQGWGPNFLCPTRSRIDVPDYGEKFSLSQLPEPIEVKGIAYGGDRGISRVELSFDDEKTWVDAEIYYKGGDLAWSLWKAQGGWMPSGPGDFAITVRATDGKGAGQRFEEERGYFSGTSGLHKIYVHVDA